MMRTEVTSPLSVCDYRGFLCVLIFSHRANTSQIFWSTIRRDIWIMGEETKRKGFVYEWRIENFNFCWHKTGEYLESPLFHTEPSSETSWRLLLYPRGVDDGEYIGCFLLRGDGGPEIVDVDFELFVSVRGSLVKPPISFDKIYSLKIGQKEGEKSFLRRREIMSHLICRKERFTLVFGCTIFNWKRDTFEIGKLFGRTTIAMEQVSGMQVFESDELTDSEENQGIEVKAPLEVDPLISINLINFNDDLVIKIRPKNCDKIKYAVCKITVFKNWEKKKPIKQFRHWIGKIKTDIWRYDTPLPQTDAKDVETCVQKTFFLHYYFAYSVKEEYAINEIRDYGTELWIEDLSLLAPPVKIVETKETSKYMTATEALGLIYSYNSYCNITIKTIGGTINANKFVLRARSPKLKDILKDNLKSIEVPGCSIDITQKFLKFLYTDKVENLNWKQALKLCATATFYEVELLEKKCVDFLKMNLDVQNAADLVMLAESSNNLSLKSYIQKYILEHAEKVFSTDEWDKFAQNNWKLAEKCMLLRYDE